MGCKLVLSGVFICAELKVKKKRQLLWNTQLSCTMLIKNCKWSTRQWSETVTWVSCISFLWIIYIFTSMLHSILQDFKTPWLHVVLLIAVLQLIKCFRRWWRKIYKDSNNNNIILNVNKQVLKLLLVLKPVSITFTVESRLICDVAHKLIHTVTKNYHTRVT